MADELTPEARAQIAEAIAIVREDRHEKWLRAKLGPTKTEPPKPEPPKPNEPPKPDDNNNPPPPPKPTAELPKKVGLWWGAQTEETSE